MRETSRFDAFAPDEVAAIRDGLLGEAAIDVTEDPSLAARVDVVERLLEEVDGRSGPWLTGDPPEHGYYLAAWRRGDDLTVSELWFNPDAIRQWWFCRAYTGEPRWGGMSAAVNTEVVAWMPMPDPPERVDG